MKKMMRWMWLAVAAAAVYAAITVLMRSRENREIERRVVEQRTEADRKTLERLGGGELKILTFYAVPPSLIRGAKGLLCYGVASASAVDISPGVEPVTPSLSRCVEVKPEATTTYTLTARDARGRVATGTAQITVR